MPLEIVFLEPQNWRLENLEILEILEIPPVKRPLP